MPSDKDIVEEAQELLEIKNFTLMTFQVRRVLAGLMDSNDKLKTTLRALDRCQQPRCQHCTALIRTSIKDHHANRS